MWKVPNIQSNSEKVPAKFLSPCSSVWCQRWNTGPATTYLNGPKVQSRLACTKAEETVANGPITRNTSEVMPESSDRTSTSTLPSTILIGWKRAAEIHSTSVEL